MERQLLKNIINTLDGIEVKGKENMDRLLGCINALESMLKVEEIQQHNKSDVIENGG